MNLKTTNSNFLDVKSAYFYTSRWSRWNLSGLTQNNGAKIGLYRLQESGCRTGSSGYTDVAGTRLVLGFIGRAAISCGNFFPRTPVYPRCVGGTSLPVCNPVPPGILRSNVPVLDWDIAQERGDSGRKDHLHCKIFVFDFCRLRLFGSLLLPFSPSECFETFQNSCSGCVPLTYMFREDSL